MAPSASALLVCDCISWRLDLFERALDRIGEVVRKWDQLAEVQLAYRLKDDVAFLALEPGLQGDARLGTLAVAEARLPGLRLLDLGHDGATTERLRDRAFASCDLVTGALTVSDAVNRLRSTLGMTDDRRTTLRLAVDLPVRYATPGGWVDTATRDLSLSGIFIRTQAHFPDLEDTVELELFPRTPEVVKTVATVVRHTEDGFGARLSLSLEAQEAVYGRIRPLRLSPHGTPASASVRVPMQVDINLALATGTSREKAENLSRGGAFIRSDHPPKPGTAVKLDVQLGEGAPVKLDGNVVRVREQAAEQDPCGFGVEFQSLTDNAREMIDRFISDALTQPFARVLVALPIESHRTLVAVALKQRRCAVLSTSTAQEAFEEIVANLLSVDMVLIDQTLPGGVTNLLHRVRKVGGELDLPVVVIAEGGANESLLQEGVTAVVPPAAPEVLARSCLDLITQHRNKKRR
jgi:uncharacterized protein (TIGR02266 family)